MSGGGGAAVLGKVPAPLLWWLGFNDQWNFQRELAKSYQHYFRHILLGPAMPIPEISPTEELTLAQKSSLCPKTGNNPTVNQQGTRWTSYGKSRSSEMISKKHLRGRKLFADTSRNRTGGAAPRVGQFISHTPIFTDT